MEAHSFGQEESSWAGGPGGGGGGHEWSGVDTPFSSSRACPTAFIASPVPVYVPGCMFAPLCWSLTSLVRVSGCQLAAGSGLYRLLPGLGLAPWVWAVALYIVFHGGGGGATPPSSNASLPAPLPSPRGER